MAIENTSLQSIISIHNAQREFFHSGATLDYDFRVKQLKALGAALRKWQMPLCEALWHDLHKSEQEAILTELSIVEGEVRNHLRHLKSWMKRQRCSTPLKMLPTLLAVFDIVSEILLSTSVIDSLFDCIDGRLLILVERFTPPKAMSDTD